MRSIEVRNQNNLVIMSVTNRVTLCVGCCGQFHFCGHFFCNSCGHEAVIYAPPGNKIGTVRQKATRNCGRSYLIYDENDVAIFVIDSSLFCNVLFPDFNTELIINSAKKPANKYSSLRHINNMASLTNGQTLRLG